MLHVAPAGGDTWPWEHRGPGAPQGGERGQLPSESRWGRGRGGGVSLWDHLRLRSSHPASRLPAGAHRVSDALPPRPRLSVSAGRCVSPGLGGSRWGPGGALPVIPPPRLRGTPLPCVVLPTYVTLTHNGVWMGASCRPASTVKKLTSE